MKLFAEIMTTYAVTIIVTSSSIMEDFRSWFKHSTQGTVLDKKPKHFIECRLCFGFWASVAICLLYEDVASMLVVYGASYFMATQER